MAVDENEMAAPIAVTVESGAFKFDALDDAIRRIGPSQATDV
jgi:hypothetical protein